MNTYKKYKAESEIGEKLARTIENILSYWNVDEWRAQISYALHEYWRDVKKIEED